MSLCLTSTAALNSLGLPHLLKQNTIRGKQKNFTYSFDMYIWGDMYK